MILHRTVLQPLVESQRESIDRKLEVCFSVAWLLFATLAQLNGAEGKGTPGDCQRTSSMLRVRRTLLRARGETVNLGT